MSYVKVCIFFKLEPPLKVKVDCVNCVKIIRVYSEYHILTGYLFEGQLQEWIMNLCEFYTEISNVIYEYTYKII